MPHPPRPRELRPRLGAPLLEHLLDVGGTALPYQPGEPIFGWPTRKPPHGGWWSVAFDSRLERVVDSVIVESLGFHRTRQQAIERAEALRAAFLADRRSRAELWLAGDREVWDAHRGAPPALDGAPLDWVRACAWAGQRAWRCATATDEVDPDRNYGYDVLGQDELFFADQPAALRAARRLTRAHHTVALERPAGAVQILVATVEAVVFAWDADEEEMRADPDPASDVAARTSTSEIPDEVLEQARAFAARVIS
jgi:hypothetical protein